MLMTQCQQSDGLWLGATVCVKQCIDNMTESCQL
jgi:hypothetical protein